jgi:hypothetical protein
MGVPHAARGTKSRCSLNTEREYMMSAKISSEICNRLAYRLDDYLKFRANKEGVAYGLDLQFFLKAMDAGTWHFFGITADKKTGTLTEDIQNPTIFDAWLRNSRVTSSPPD